MQSRPDAKATNKLGHKTFDSSKNNRANAQLWKILTDARIVGALLAVVGVFCLLTPWTQTAAQSGQDWWTRAAHLPASLSMVAVLVWIAVVAVMTQLWARRGQFHSKILPVGILLGVVGGGALVFSWLMSTSTVPAARVSVTPQSMLEYYEMPLAHRTMRRMLPARLSISEVRFSNDPSIHVRFFHAGEDTAIGYRELRPREFVDFEGVRVGFIGWDTSKPSMRVLLKNEEENTIAVTGTIGQRVHFSPEDPGYEIVEIIENYLDTLGPAVKLATSDGDEFWIYQSRASEMVNWGHPLKLESVQVTPSVILSFKSPVSTTLFGASVGLFILGILLSVVALIRRQFNEHSGKSRRLSGLGGLPGVLSISVVVVVWGGWVMASWLNWYVFGAYGLGSPSEWNAVGTVLLVSGGLMICWPWMRTENDRLAWASLAALSTFIVLSFVISHSLQAFWGTSIPY